MLIFLLLLSHVAQNFVRGLVYLHTENRKQFRFLLTTFSHRNKGSHDGEKKDGVREKCLGTPKKEWRTTPQESYTADDRGYNV